MDVYFGELKDPKEGSISTQNEQFIEDCQGYFLAIGKSCRCAKYGVQCSNISCQHGREL